MLNSLLTTDELSFIPTNITSTTDAIVALCSVAHPQATTIIEKLWGRPITYLPTYQPTKPKHQILDDLNAQLASKREAYKDMRRFRHVLDNPRRPSSGLGQRYNIIREGMTVGEYVNRGGRLRDVRWGLRRGHFRLEER